MTMLSFSQLDFKAYLKQSMLAKLDEAFLAKVKESNKNLYRDILRYREDSSTLSNLQTSELIIQAARLLDHFLVDFFNIHTAYGEHQASVLKNEPVFAFKKWIVLRQAKRRLLRDEALDDFNTLNEWLNTQIADKADRELAVSEFAITLLDDKEANKDKIEKLVQWTLHCLKTESSIVKDWASFKLPQRTDYKKLIPLVVVNEPNAISALPNDQQRLRDGFDLTDERMSEREVQSEIDYCVLCHDHDGDFCSKGFPEKKGDPSQGFRKNPLDNILTGCPLDEKISEMNTLQKEGASIAALATIMIDNPMCPATGHRICNDCMKACIYQKQTPVDVPQIETKILSDVLELPYGVEIYDLLTRWNPLRAEQYQQKPANHKKVFVAGMGPAGFTMAYHLLMEGCTVVGSDGLKIESLPDVYLNNPIENYINLNERLSERVMAGFGGVAEYGITVRWDKNFLKLIYISLMRREQFQVFDGVRFGGTVTIESLYAMGFDHVTIAVGAGLPKALPIPGSMAPGMRQANDFLMALQLTGAAKASTLANLQLRMPVVIVGGGLTGVDAATEAQAYYVKQVEKTLARYEALCASSNEHTVRQTFDEESLVILDEFLEHGKRVREERRRAEAADEKPNFTQLIHEWGGVTIAYRRNIEDSPAYISNHEELYKAMEEGLFYAEGLNPLEVKVDNFGRTSAIVFEKRIKNDEGEFEDSNEFVTLPAKSILVATGASPNVAYDFEHQHVLKRTRFQYNGYQLQNGELKPIEPGAHVKVDTIGPLTSYDKNQQFVSFIGDVHPTFHGNVVRAIASAKRSYPEVMKALAEKASSHDQHFSNTMTEAFSTTLIAKRVLNNDATELTFKTPAAARAFKPGQFYRLQNYERTAEIYQDTLLQMEPLALLGVSADHEHGLLRLLVLNRGTSSAIAAQLKENEKVSLMGPTGVRSKVPEKPEHILVVANSIGIAYALAMATPLKTAGSTISVLAYANNEADFFYQSELSTLCENLILTTDNPLETLNKHKDLLGKADRITVFGDAALLKAFQARRHAEWKSSLKATVKIFANVHSNMQCMLKGVCAQCLQWQIDPETGLRKKAVFACSWQDQPLELIDYENYAERMRQNAMSETLSRLWLKHISAS